MSTNGINTTDDADMSECGGEKVVTMMDVLQEQEEFEEDANAVLGASDDKDCTYSKGYIKRQAIYACLTCCGEAKSDPTKRAGVCLACSLSCHENHELVELYTKRNFRCDCGNPKFNAHPCQFTPNKTEFNEENDYNQNFSGLYCTCHRPYPDPENTLDDDEMIQCIVCEDWLHASHLEATIPSEQYAEMICKGCMDRNKFIHDYSEFAVNEDVDIETAVESEDAISVNGNSECNGSEKEINDIDSSLTNEDNKTKEEMEVDESIMNQTETATKLEEEEDNLEKDKANKESEESDKTNNCYDKETDSGNMSLQKVAANDNVDKSDDTNIAESKDSEVEAVCTDSKNAEAETVGSESKDIETAGAESKDTKAAATESKDTETEGTESKDTETAGIESKDTETEGAESNDTETADTESKDTETAGTESKDTETEGAESNDTETADTESKDTETAGTESKNTETVSAESKDTETAGTETKDIEADAEVIEPKTDNENEIRPSAEGGHSTETTDSSKVTSDSVPDTDAKVAENRSITEEDEEQSKEREHLGNQTSSNSEDTDNNKESSENNVEMTHIKIDDTNNSNKMETDETVAETLSNDISNKEEQITSDISNNDAINNDKDSNKVESASNESEDSQRTNDQSLEKNQVPKDMEVLSNPQENKRKLSTEHSETEDVIMKKAKLEESKQCVRPKGIKKRFRGATFWSSNIRQKFCTCNECITMYKDLSVLFLIDPEDTVTAYEALGKENIDGTASQYEKGLQALSSLGRIQQINALTEYNKMRDKLLDFLKSFKERKEVVKEEDIKAFFAGMKPKREPDGVYFCR